MPAPLDFAAIFDLAPNAYMVLDEELRYVAANQAYLAVTSMTLDGLLGRRIFELFPNDPALLKPPFDRSHKKPGGYIIKHKLEAAKARAASEAGE